MDTDIAHAVLVGIADDEDMSPPSTPPQSAVVDVRDVDPSAAGFFSSCYAQHLNALGLSPSSHAAALARQSRLALSSDSEDDVFLTLVEPARKTRAKRSQPPVAKSASTCGGLAELHAFLGTHMLRFVERFPHYEYRIYAIVTIDSMEDFELFSTLYAPACRLVAPHFWFVEHIVPLAPQAHQNVDALLSESYELTRAGCELEALGRAQGNCFGFDVRVLHSPHVEAGTGRRHHRIAKFCSIYSDS